MHNALTINNTKTDLSSSSSLTDSSHQYLKKRILNGKSKLKKRIAAKGFSDHFRIRNFRIRAALQSLLFDQHSNFKNERE